MKGITRISSGYLARHYWGKPEPIYEYFYDHEYGSKEKAEEAAKSWLERIAKEYPAPESKGRKPIMGYIEDSYGFRSAAVYVAWTSQPDNVQHKREFTYAEYGSKESAEAVAKKFYEARLKDFSESPSK